MDPFVRYRLSREGRNHLRERHLTTRQVDMIEATINFSTVEEVAGFLGVTPSTIVGARVATYRTLGVKNLPDLYIYLFPYIEAIPQPDYDDEVPSLPAGKAIAAVDQSGGRTT